MLQGMLMTEKDLKNKIIEKYLNSDFNGLAFSKFAKNFNNIQDAKLCVKKFINDGDVEIIHDPNNPHIKVFDFSSEQETFFKKII